MQILKQMALLVTPLAEAGLQVSPPSRKPSERAALKLVFTQATAQTEVGVKDRNNP